MRILCHAGPWSDEYLTFIAKEMYPNATVLVLSGHKKIDKSDLCRKYYGWFEKKQPPLSLGSNPNNAEVILRCRLLRTIRLEEATLHVEAMRQSISEVLDEFHPNLILTETIDSYLMDLLEEQSKLRQIPFVGLVTSFINGYFRVSARGELNIVRTPTEEEVVKIYNSLVQKDYRPDFVRSAIKNHKREVVRRWLRNMIKIPYFAIKRHLSNGREKFNYHYWVTELIAKETFHFFPSLNLGKKQWRDEVSRTNKKIIYVPLQVSPEATIDYWCQSVSFINYEETLIDIFNKYSEFHFLVKEHPNIQGFRHPDFYKKLDKISNVTICPTTVGKSEIKTYISAALVWTGTLGFELALEDFPVLTVCKPYYLFGDMFLEISKNTTFENILAFIVNRKKQSLDAKKAMIKNLLSGNLVGRLRVDGSWRLSNDSHKNEAIVLARSIKFALDSKVDNQNSTEK